MKREEILQEMVAIYEKYFSIIEELGTLKMSPQDKERLSELKSKLEV